MKVLIAAAEAVPFVKTGGLADVIGSLPAELRRQGVDARVIMPLYRNIPAVFREGMRPVTDITLPLAWRRQYCGLQKLLYEEVPIYFVDNEYYFARERLYGYDDDAERFAFFSRGVVELIPHLGFSPAVIHCNDWHTGLVGAYLRALQPDKPYCRDIASLFTIHNIQYQGVFPSTVLSDVLGLDNSCFTPEGLEFFGGVNYLKAGVVFADAINTVSNTYASEIQKPEYGQNLDGLLRKRHNELSGIVNGIDYRLYNPEGDPHILAPYSARSQAGKALNKKRIQEMLGLPAVADRPLLAIISRLVDHKGLDLILQALPQLLAEDLQLIVLGTGEERYEQLFRETAQRFPEKVVALIQFDEALAHKIYAGADIFLMPSRTEPCGIGQLIAMRYGAVPVVRETGGLKDTVQPYEEATGTGNGFCFVPYDGAAMLGSLRQALAYYRQRPVWRKLVRAAMKQDYSWQYSAGQYNALYEKLQEMRKLHDS